MTFRAHALLAVLTATSLSAGPGTVPAGGPGDVGPTVVLRGEADTELAPHGAGNVYAPCVLRDKDVYRMWYGGQGRDGHDRIHYAESADGAAWARRGVVLEDRAANHVNDPCVLKVGDGYLMYYTRTEKDVVDRIDVAASQDGVAWEPKGVALAAGAGGAWDALSVGRPTVVREDGVFRLWYDGRKDFPPGAPVRGVPTSQTSRRAVGHATSADGLRFVRRGAGPVLENDAGGADVKRVGGRLVMAYESRDGTRFAAGADGVAWADGGLLVGRSEAAADAFGHVTPCLLVDADGGGGRLYVGAARAATWDRNAIAALAIPA
ncbi:MAG: Laminin sub domain 2, partial [Phycisphaerales bacterium]|nr:Laminin sub domain 2 [Phycisphaerales bacterium]